MTADLFSIDYDEKIREALDAPMKTVRLLSLFSGIGAFEKALDRCDIPYELVAYCEIDKYASKSYSAIHGVSEDKNLWDVCKVDAKPLRGTIDLMTYGFPCQDISIGGKMKGLYDEDGGYTRSGLFFEALRIIKECQPRIAIAENVKNLMSQAFVDQYHTVQEELGGGKLQQLRSDSERKGLRHSSEPGEGFHHIHQKRHRHGLCVSQSDTSQAVSQRSLGGQRGREVFPLRRDHQGI